MTRRAIPLLAALLLATPALLLAAPAGAAPAKAPKPEAPATADGLIASARAAAARGETDLGLRLAQSAIVARPSHTASYVTLGDIYAAMGQAEFARSYYEAALSIEPLDAAAKKAMTALDAHTDTTANARQ